MIRPPVFPDDEDKTRAARLLFTILYLQWALVMLIYIPSTLFTAGLLLVPTEKIRTHAQPHLALLAIVPLVLFLAWLMIFAHQGEIKTTSILLVSITYCVVATSSAMLGLGTNAFAYLVSTFFLLIAAGLLIGPRFVAGFSVFIILTGFLTSYAQTTGLLLPQPLNGDALPGILEPWLSNGRATFIVIVAEAGVLLSLAAFSINDALQRARKELIDRRQVEATLRQQTEYLISLHETALALINHLELHPLLESILTRACQYLDTPHSYIDILKPDGSALKQEISRGVFGQFIGMETNKGDGIAGRVWASGKMLMIEDYAEWEYRIPQLENVGMRACLALPLISDGQVIGTIGLAYMEADRKFSPSQVELMQRFAALASLAIDNARLYQASRNELAERKQVEIALRESQVRLQAVLNHIPFDLWVCDAQGRYIMQNIAAQEYSSDVLGKTALELGNVPLEIRQRWQYEHELALQGQTYRNDAIMETIKGEDRNFIITVNPITSEDTIIGLVGMSVDVTALKHAEAEVRILNEELEQRVSERTIQLRTAVQELESFSYSVSHDLRAPLRAISGFTSILIEEFSQDLDPAAINYLHRIQQSAGKMGALIDDLLQFSRISRQPVKRESIDMQKMAETIYAELLAGEHGTRQIEFILNEMPNALGDAALLRQVFANLLSNAIKYTGKREKALIEVGYKRGSARRLNQDAENSGSTPEDGMNISGEDDEIFFVRDNGAGFDMRYEDKLFGVFQRLHRDDEFEGTGVGLAIAYRIIQKHGGRIWAESTPEQGATFYFTVR